MSFDDISRLTDRARTKLIERALAADALPRSTSRLMKREAGPEPLSTPQVQIVSREAAVRLSGSEDLRSDLIRRIVQMEVLDAARAVSWSSDGGGEDAGDDDGGGSGDSSAPTSADGIFEQWFQEMQGQGLNKAEIEEHLISRIRAVRRGIQGADEERRLRRK